MKSPTLLTEVVRPIIKKLTKHPHFYNSFSQDDVSYSYYYSGGCFEHLVGYNFIEELRFRLTISYRDCSKEYWDLHLEDPKSFDAIEIIIKMAAINAHISRKAHRCDFGADKKSEIQPALCKPISHVTKGNWHAEANRFKISVPEVDWSYGQTNESRQIISAYQKREYEKWDIEPIIPYYKDKE